MQIKLSKVGNEQRVVEFACAILGQEGGALFGELDHFGAPGNQPGDFAHHSAQVQRPQIVLVDDLVHFQNGLALQGRKCHALQHVPHKDAIKIARRRGGGALLLLEGQQELARVLEKRGNSVVDNRKRPVQTQGTGGVLPIGLAQPPEVLFKSADKAGVWSVRIIEQARLDSD